MKSFPLKIVTPSGVSFEGEATSVTVRTIGGDVGILAGHTDYVTPLGMGTARICCGDTVRYAACIGGLISVSQGSVRLVPTTFEWEEDIDISRANASADRAKKVLDHREEHSSAEIALAEARLKRALVRTNIRH